MFSENKYLYRMKYVCIFLQSLAYLVFSFIYLEKNPRIILTSIFVTRVQSIYMSCSLLWNDMYIKLLIVKMSGEYLYFSLSAPLKTLYNICHMIFSIFPIYFSFCLLQPQIFGAQTLLSTSHINLIKILESLGQILTDIQGCEWREDPFQLDISSVKGQTKGFQSLNAEWQIDSDTFSSESEYEFKLFI